MLLIFLSPCIAIYLRGKGDIFLSNKSTLFTPLFLYASLSITITMIIFIAFKANSHLSKFFSIQEALIILATSVISISVSSLIIFVISRLDGIPRSLPIIHALVLIALLFIPRIASRIINDYLNLYIRDYTEALKASCNIKRVIIVGLDPFAAAVVRLTQAQRPRTADIIAMIPLKRENSGQALENLRIIGDTSVIDIIVDEFTVHGVEVNEVWLSDSSIYYNNAVYDLVKDKLKRKPVLVRKMSEVFCLFPIEDNNKIERMPELYNSILRSKYFYFKRGLDIIVSALIFSILLPVFIFIIIITLFDNGPPVLFWQERIGMHGKSFRLYKIRTLRQPVDHDGAMLPDERRISFSGKIIRKLRLDEIPQLISVIIGDMSGIGPRPLLPRDQPKDNIVRLLIKPGITGWAQVNGGELLNPEEKNALDCWYLYHISFYLDAAIVALTIKTMFYGVSRNNQKIEEALKWMESMR